MYANTIALARRLNKPVVVFDLEHTGGKGAGRCVTEFGAYRVTPDGLVTSYSSLVKPPDTAIFSPYVCNLTGIYPETLAAAPGWSQVLQEFVLPNCDALWVGFASRTNDAPLVMKESLHVGHQLAPLHQLDLMRVGTVKGRLPVRLAQLVPGFDTSGAHRSLKDALMTLTLLEAQLPLLNEHELTQHLALKQPRRPRVKQPRLATDAVHVKRKLDVRQFLAASGVSRKGQPWSDDEVIWVCRQYRGAKKTVEQLAELNGRHPFAVASALCREGLITDQVRDTFKKS